MDFNFRNIAKEPPTDTELREIAKVGGYTIEQLVNTRGQKYKKMKPELSLMDEGEIIGLIRENPSIMIRPILIDDKQLVAGFKEEKYIEFLNHEVK